MTKKLAIIILLMFGISTAYSQTISLDRSDYDKMIEKEKSLQIQINNLCDSIVTIYQKHANETRILSDSIQKINAKLDDTEKKLTKLKDDLHNLQEQFDKNKIRKERDTLKKKVEVLNDTITNLKSEIATCEKKAEARYSEGREEICKTIAGGYDAELDTLVKIYKLATVERDLSFVVTATKKKMQDLRTYFRAEQVLFEKYNETKVQPALDSLETITSETQAVKALKDRLNYYKNCTEALKSTIEAISEIDKTNKAAGEHSEASKRGKIMSEISSFVYNQDFYFTDYPYLADIVLKIMKAKQRDVNKDISECLNEL